MNRLNELTDADIRDIAQDALEIAGPSICGLSVAEGGKVLRPDPGDEESPVCVEVWFNLHPRDFPSLFPERE